MRTMTMVLLMLAATAGAQYRCDWCVVGIGGGVMTSSAYRCGATAGQTAAGSITGTQCWAMIGFWNNSVRMDGIHEQAYSPSQGPLVTRLYAPQPNPSRAAALHYTLAVAGNVALSVHDLTGRQVRVLVNSQQKPGRYSVTWDGCDHLGRSLANGVYFCRFAAGDYHATEKLVLQR